MVIPKISFKQMGCHSLAFEASVVIWQKLSPHLQLQYAAKILIRRGEQKRNTNQGQKAK
jgi:hypothetical protein